MGTKDFKAIARRFAKINTPDNSDMAFLATAAMKQVVSYSEFLLQVADALGFQVHDNGEIYNADERVDREEMLEKIRTLMQSHHAAWI